jgi:hypothetical protein
MYNKTEILKKYNLSEEDFYKKFPTREDYEKFENGGQLNSRQKYATGGPVLTPLAFDMPSSLTTPVQSFTPGVNAPAPTSGSEFKLPNISGLNSGGQQAPQQAGSDPNAPSKKNTFKSIGSVGLGVGLAAAGTAIAPGIGTTIGGMIGSTVGGAVGGLADKKVFENKMEDYNTNKSSQQNAMASNIPGNFNPNAPTKQFENGGLINFKGNTHENGGIALPDGQSEVEDGETKIGNFIFSNNLLYNKKQTFADKSKSIDKKYFRDNDKIDAMGKKLELEKLSNQQENMKQLMMITDLSTKYMNGGRLKKKYKWGTNEFDNVTGETGTYGNQVYGDLFNQQPTIKAPFVENYTMTPDSETTLSKAGQWIGLNKPSDLPTDLTNQIGKGKEITGLQSPYRIKSSNNPPKPPNKFDFKKYGNLAGQLVGDGYNVLQGLKGGDPVNFDRMNSKYQFIDPRGAITAANRGITSAYNSAKNAVRNTATSAGEYLANMGSLASKEGMDKATAITNIKGQYDAGNIQGLNQTNLTKDQYNAQIQMKESDARQQEQDAARSAISRGLSDIGSKIGSFNNEKSARNNQNNLITLMSSNGYKLITGKNGELSFEKDGQYVPYNVAINSVLQPKKIINNEIF